MLFKQILIHAGPHAWYNRINQPLWAIKVPRSHGFVLGLPPRGGFMKIVQVTMKHDPLMPCMNPCRLYLHLAFTYLVGPSSIVWRELGPAPPFPPMRVLEVYWSRALSLVCEVALNPIILQDHVSSTSLVLLPFYCDGICSIVAIVRDCTFIHPNE
jgi:hypothetical protein